MSKQLFLFAGMALLAVAFTAQADVLASYAFNNPAGVNKTYAQVGTETNDYFSADVVAEKVTAANFVFGAGLSDSLVASFGTLYTAEGTGPLADGINNNMAGAVTADQYFGFTVTADEGRTIDLTSLVFEVGRLANGAQDYAVRSDVDNFAANIAFGDDAIPLYGNLNGATLTEQTITLTGAAFQGLESIELRIYFDDRATDTSSTSGTNIDNVVLNGTVPEPATIGMLGLGALITLLLRRHKA